MTVPVEIDGQVVRNPDLLLFSVFDVDAAPVVTAVDTGASVTLTGSRPGRGPLWFAGGLPIDYESGALRMRMEIPGLAPVAFTICWEPSLTPTPGEPPTPPRRPRTRRPKRAPDSRRQPT